MDHLWQEAVDAIRRLRRAPGFAIPAVVTLSLGIGACALMLNIVSGVLLTPLPYKDPSRAVMIWGYYPQIDLGYSEQPISGLYLTSIRDNTTALSAVAGFQAEAFNLGGVANPERLDGIETTGDFFDAVGVAPQLGQFFTRANEPSGADRVVVISDALWRRRFGTDRSIIGRTIDLNTLPYTVVAVAPPGFNFPRGAEMPADFQFPAQSDVWVPMLPPQRGPSTLALVGHIRPDVSVDGARQDMKRIEAIQERLQPVGKGSFGTQIAPLQRQMVGNIRPILLSLLAAVSVLLLIACVNTAQLQLAQLQRRQREMAIRSALGALRHRIVASIVAEVLVLSISAGLIGTLVAWMGMRVVRVMSATRLPQLANTSFDMRTAAAILSATLLAALLTLLGPTVLISRSSIVTALRQGGRGMIGGGASTRLRRLLIVTELTLSVVLVAGAGLLTRSLAKQLRSATGFTAPNGLTFEITLPPVRYPEQQFRTYMEHPTAVAFFTAALDRIRAVPGVQAAAIGKPLPLSGAQEATVFTPEGAPPPPTPAQTPIAEYTVASSDMFRALGTPIITGRDFTPADREDALPVIMVNESMAAWLWPGQSALGKRIHVGLYNMNPPWMTVVGVTADLKRYSLTEKPRPEMIVPYTQKPYPSFSTMQFVVRSSMPAGQLLPALTAAIASVDPGIPIAQVRTIDDLVAATTATARFATRLMTAFGLAALVLAMIGLYGVIAYGVYQRRQEFGIRRALGATPQGILQHVLIEALRLAGIGVVAGTALAIVAGRAARQLLYEVPAYDAVTLGGTATILALATLGACLVPAWRASVVAPKVALEDS